MCGQNRNIVDASELFLKERIPFSSPVFFHCHRKSIFKQLFIIIFIHSFTTAAGVGTSIRGCFLSHFWPMLPLLFPNLCYRTKC